MDVTSETKMYNLLRDMKMNKNRKTTSCHNTKTSLQEDESSSYDTRKETLGVTYISVGHRPSIRKHHEKLLNLLPDGGYEFTTMNNNTSGSFHIDDDNDDHHI